MMKTRLLAMAVVALVLFPASLTVAQASNHAQSYQYAIGCCIPPVTGPDVSMASDGSMISLSGSGTFTIQGTARSITGGGSYTVTDAAGNVTSSGTWTATHLEGFVSYGSSPGLPPTFEGGELHMQIMLSGLGTAESVVTCLLGTPPPSKMEGIRVDVGSEHYTMKVSGDTVFVAQ